MLVRTLDRLVPDDSDDQPDLYLLQAHRAPRLVSTGPLGGNGPYAAHAAYPRLPINPFSVAEPSVSAVLAANGNRVFFSTVERLTAEDRDASEDIYAWDYGTVRLVSTGVGRGNGEAGPSPSTFGYQLVASDDGRRVHFTTPEQLTVDDQNASSDLYLRSQETTSLESIGPAGGNRTMPDDDLFFAKNRFGASNGFFSADDSLRTSRDGTRVAFSTTEQLTGDDRDSNRDVYLRRGERLVRVSNGPIGGNRHRAAVLEGISGDAQRVFFSTTERLTGDDRDHSRDVYEWHDATTRRVSGSGRGGNGPFTARYVGATNDGGCVFLETAERLMPSDRDHGPDVYRSCSLRRAKK